ncbi:MAG: hypothetical protein LUO84_06410 [Methanomassiliicoccales archaeon]|nr:hypothetical protein [Methanomassiliicoccales archaeon]
MDTGRVLRRIVHVSTPLFLVYYFLPDPLWTGGPTRVLTLIVIMAVVLIAEVLRLAYKPKIIGMREYEKYQVSAAAWAGIGMTITFLFFPFGYAAPAFMGMGWVDPVIGDLRRKSSSLYPYVPLVLYFLIAIVSMSVIIGPSIKVIIASLLATPAAIWAERLKSKYVDDDFLMMVVPLIVIASVFEVLP